MYCLHKMKKTIITILLVEVCFACGNEGEAAVKSLACKKARNRVLLIDSSKLDKVMPFTFANAEDIDYLICDKPLPSSMAEYLRQKGVTIL